MKNKELKFESELHDKMSQGVTMLADAVTSTMGAHGSYVIIEDPNGFCRTTKDGVSVAKEIKFEDSFVNMGARIVIDSAINTVNDIGDGTTTTILLASEMYKAWNELDDKTNTRFFVDTLMEQVDYCMGLIDGKYSLGKPNKEDLIAVATISANNNREIGTLVGEVFNVVGKDGVVFLNRSEHDKSYYKIDNSLSIGNGYYSPLFTNNKNKSILKDCYVLSTNMEMKSAKDIIGLLNEVAKSEEKAIFIMSPSFSNDFVASLYANKKNGTFDVCLVETPPQQHLSGIDEDLAYYTGGEYIDGYTGKTLQSLKLEDLGRAKTITTSATKVVVEQGEVTDKFRSHIDRLMSDLDSKRTERYKEQTKTRIARLNGKMAVIYVGGVGEVDFNYNFDVFDDSIKATQSSLKTGISIGGGVVYLRLSYDLFNKYGFHTPLSIALSKPLEKLMINSSVHDKYNTIKEKILDKPDDSVMGYDLLNPTFELVDLKSRGIVEPTGLIKACIKNASHIVTHLCSSKTGISIVKELF